MVRQRCIQFTPLGWPQAQVHFALCSANVPHAMPLNYWLRSNAQQWIYALHHQRARPQLPTAFSAPRDLADFSVTYMFSCKIRTISTFICRCLQGKESFKSEMSSCMEFHHERSIMILLLINCTFADLGSGTFCPHNSSRWNRLGRTEKFWLQIKLTWLSTVCMNNQALKRHQKASVGLQDYKFENEKKLGVWS